MIRDNGDVVEALLCLGAWLVLTVAGVWLMCTVENWFNNRREK